ncbi:MAG: hypothetical protein GQ526_09865 [Ardenticatenales bacterium]|nr:hypothetical protein [Ardenticatenales bacterium]
MEFARSALYLLLNSPTPLSLAQADLSGANFEGATLIRANLRRAAMDDTDFTGAILPDDGVSSNES